MNHEFNAKLFITKRVFSELLIKYELFITAHNFSVTANQGLTDDRLCRHIYKGMALNLSIVYVMSSMILDKGCIHVNKQLCTDLVSCSIFGGFLGFFCLSQRHFAYVVIYPK